MRWKISDNERWAVGLTMAFIAMMMYWCCPIEPYEAIPVEQVLPLAVLVLVFGEFVYWTFKWDNEETYENDIWGNTMVGKAVCIIMGILAIGGALITAGALKVLWDWIGMNSGQACIAVTSSAIILIWLWLNTFRWKLPKAEPTYTVIEGCHGHGLSALKKRVKKKVKKKRKR